MRKPLLTCLAAIALLGCALYIPFLGNPLIFDDLPFFSSDKFAYFAMTPAGVGLRLPPYFSLAASQVLWGQFPPWNHAEIHRVIALVIHIACAWALYKLTFDLINAVQDGPQKGDPRDASEHASLLAFIGAVAFTIHPVAVYGAGYLVQRTILMATLFSLLSIIFVVRGLVRGHLANAFAAALFYTLAVLSKEHALLLPAAAAMASPLVSRDRRFTIRFIGIYWLACLPAAVMVAALVRGLIGTVYEPRAEMLLEQINDIPLLEASGGAWFVSLVTQAGLFFKYLILWVVPNTGMMAIDVRVDFSQAWSTGWIVAKLIAFAAFGILGAVLLGKRGKIGLIGFGMIYVWISFIVELGAVRFQEPFVLYRSYLWAPGILIALVVLVSTIPRKGAAVLSVAIFLALFYQARDRLQSFSSNLALWEDAAAKLPDKPILYGSRVLFGAVREQVYAGQLGRAAQTATRCLEHYPNSWHCNFSRGAVYNQLGEYAQALTYFDRALAADPGSGVGYMQRGISLERLGRADEAKNAYRRAAALGFLGGDYRLSLMENTTDSRGMRTLYDSSVLSRTSQ